METNIDTITQDQNQSALDLEVMVTCCNCGETVPESDSICSTIAARVYCVDCYDERFTRCCECESELYTDDACYWGDYDYCLSCLSDVSFVCEGCGERRSWDYHAQDDRCEDCFTPDSRDNLNAYDYRPYFTFRRSEADKADNNLFFGFELEVENLGGADFDEYTYDAENIGLYTKSDGSLENGMEIVSHPCTALYHREMFGQYSTLLRNLANAGFRSYETTTCGMHIHASKDAVSNYHLYKVMRFFYDNPAFILRVSQRRQEMLERWARVKFSPDGTGEHRTAVSAAKYKANFVKYTAINLSPEKTIEFRIFRGTLNIHSFFKNLEFVQAVLAFTKGAGMNELTPDVFMQFVAQNAKEFENLHKFLINKPLTNCEDE